MKRTQKGITLIGFIIVLGVVGVFVYLGMKVLPMYSEFYAVKQALNGLAEEPGISTADANRIKAKFYGRLNVGYVENVKEQNVKVSRKEAGWVMTVEYEVRRPLVANLDVVGHFRAEKELRRNAGDN
jgi:hypothetical protein